MPAFPKIILHKHKSDAVLRRHPWIFSGAIYQKEKGIEEGDVVEVFDHKGTYLATGHYSSGSIAVRIFSFNQTNDLNALWRQKIEFAWQVRTAAGLTGQSHTNMFRLLFAEGDFVPGLIADWYDGTVVLQAHSLGMYKALPQITDALQSVLGKSLKAVFNKSSNTLHSNANGIPDGWLLGEELNTTALENGLQFTIDWEQGQKTGFFIDQREHRKLLGQYSAGKKVLNTFCYTGGFSLYALQGGATEVHSVDSSARAMQLTDSNIALNGFDTAAHHSHTADVFEYLKNSMPHYFDVIVLDPPAFAKNTGARHNAVQAYTRLNAQAIEKIKPGGLLFTFSCSQVVTPPLFHGAVVAAAIRCGRQARILHHLYQPADHPVSAYHPEGLYLKGLVLHIE